MNVLITGAKGFLGKHLTSYLVEKHNLFLTARIKDDDKVDYLDLEDFDSVESYIEEQKVNSIEAVIHTAGSLINGDMSQEEQMKVFEDNITITRNIVELVQKLNVKVLVNCSSMAVYPNIDGEFDERSEIRMSCNSECLYGLSKFCSENIFEYTLSNCCRVINLRLAQVYGEGMREDRFPFIIKQSIIEDNRVEIFGNGERISNFVSVERVCEEIDKIIRFEDVSGIYNMGGENISYLKFAKYMKTKYGNSNTQIILKNSGSKAKFYLNTEKLEKLWKQKVNF